MKIHAIISAALSLAVRYEWIDRNPAERVTLPRLRKRQPDPPSPKLAARLLNEVWQDDEEFGLYLWAAMTTGARRGELLALRESRFDFDTQEVRVLPGPHWLTAMEPGHDDPPVRAFLVAGGHLQLAEGAEALLCDAIAVERR